jgi:Flp pilus assembly protein TadG
MPIRLGGAGGERGAAAVEFALVLIPLVLLLLGIIEFSRAYNALVSLDHAAREGVRVLAISGQADDAIERTLAAATSLDPNSINVTYQGCDAGPSATINASLPFTPNIPFWDRSGQQIILTGTGVMRCGG